MIKKKYLLFSLLALNPPIISEDNNTNNISNEEEKSNTISLSGWILFLILGYGALYADSK